MKRFTRITIRRSVRGELLGVLLFGYALPLVWVIAIVADYLRHTR